MTLVCAYHTVRSVRHHRSLILIIHLHNSSSNVERPHHREHSQKVEKHCFIAMLAQFLRACLSKEGSGGLPPALLNARLRAPTHTRVFRIGLYPPTVSVTRSRNACESKCTYDTPPTTNQRPHNKRIKPGNSSRMHVDITDHQEHYNAPVALKKRLKTVYRFFTVFLHPRSTFKNPGR